MTGHWGEGTVKEKGKQNGCGVRGFDVLYIIYWPGTRARALAKS